METLNLTKEDTDVFWKNKNPRMHKILNMMESVEPWVLDEIPSISNELVEFGKKLAKAKTEHLTQTSEEITTIMAYIFSSKSIKLLQWIDKSFPGLSFHYIMTARYEEDWESGKLLLDRLKTLKTLSLLGNVFSSTRTKLINNLLEETDDI